MHVYIYIYIYLTSIAAWIKNPFRRASEHNHRYITRISGQNIFFNLRKIDNRNKWKNYVIATRVKLSVELYVLVMREQPIFIQL